MHTLTITSAKGQARGSLAFVPQLGHPLIGHLVLALDAELTKELDDIATVDSGSLWTPRRSYRAPLDLHQWEHLGAALMELRRRHRGLVYSWSSTPSAADLRRGDEGPEPPPWTIF